MDSNNRLKLKWLDPNHDKARRSKKHENRIAEKLGGKRIKQSGGARWSKWKSNTDDGDISTPELHIEHKRTENKSLSIKREWIEKVKEGAFRVDKIPAVVITFEQPNRPTAQDEDWILLPLEYVRRMLGHNNE